MSNLIFNLILLTGMSILLTGVVCWLFYMAEVWYDENEKGGWDE